VKVAVASSVPAAVQRWPTWTFESHAALKKCRPVTAPALADVNRTPTSTGSGSYWKNAGASAAVKRPAAPGMPSQPSASVTVSTREKASPCLAAPTIAGLPPGASLAFPTAAVGPATTHSRVPWSST
jgi:hypothetical protein